MDLPHTGSAVPAHFRNARSRIFGLYSVCLGTLPLEELFLAPRPAIIRLVRSMQFPVLRSILRSTLPVAISACGTEQSICTRAKPQSSRAIDLQLAGALFSPIIFKAQ